MSISLYKWAGKQGNVYKPICVGWLTRDVDKLICVDWNQWEVDRQGNVDMPIDLGWQTRACSNAYMSCLAGKGR